MVVDFERELVKIAATVPHPETVSPDAISIAARSIQSIDVRYGIGSDNPLEYHNAYHALDVCRRGVRLTKILYQYIPPEFRDNMYDLAMVGGAVHDFWPGRNEAASAEHAVEQVRRASDPNINNETFASRLRKGIMVTEVERTKQGEIIQVNLQRGEPDPYEFIEAFADINGIAMEGQRRMFRDATNLCYEIYKTPTLEQLWNFIIDQPKFLRQRLNDGRIKSDIAYYFPDNVEPVYKVMRKAFHANIISAHGLALALGQRPELKAPIGVAARTIDRSLLGDVISQQVQRLVARP